MGVRGGVLSGRPACWKGAGAEFVAVTEGTEPRVGVGLFMTLELELEPGPGAEVAEGMPVESWVMDEVVEPAGLAGRAGMMVVVMVVVLGGVGAEKVVVGFEREGDVAKVGVGSGVVVVEEVVEIW